MLSSCSYFLWEEFGTTMPELKTYNAFENDTWLVVDRLLINKKDGSVRRLKEDTDSSVPGVWGFYYIVNFAYKYVFEESSFKEYIFLTPTGTNSGLSHKYYECVLTYNYRGEEIERSYIGKPLTEEEMKATYEAKFSNTKAFAFDVYKGLGFTSEKYDTVESQAIVGFIKERYDVNDKANNSIVVGLAKHTGDEIRFSTMLSKFRVTLSRNETVLEGVRKSGITSYNPETNEFKTVFEYNKKGKQIIDFDENGIYILDSKRNLSYVDFESNKTTLIHKFSAGIDYLVITDKYICANCAVNGYTYLVYQKGGSVIANDSYTIENDQYQN